MSGKKRSFSVLSLQGKYSILKKRTVAGRDEYGILCVIQLIPLVASIIPTEIALRKTFDKNGNRR